jgi:hypothetical protein
MTGAHYKTISTYQSRRSAPRHSSRSVSGPRAIPQDVVRVATRPPNRWCCGKSLQASSCGLCYHGSTVAAAGFCVLVKRSAGVPRHAHRNRASVRLLIDESAPDFRLQSVNVDVDPVHAIWVNLHPSLRRRAEPGKGGGILEWISCFGKATVTLSSQLLGAKCSQKFFKTAPATAISNVGAVLRILPPTREGRREKRQNDLDRLFTLRRAAAGIVAAGPDGEGAQRFLCVRSSAS